MPEGDSVYLVARKLDRALAGRAVLTSEFRVPRLALRDLAGRTVVGHDTHGKHILTRFSAPPDSAGGGEPATLHSHLRMDGAWEVTRDGKRLPSRMLTHLRVVLAVEGGTSAWGLHLHDLDLVPTSREAELVGYLGPDPLREDWDAAEATRRLLAEPEVPLVTALLDQTKLAGLGNLWVNELAFLVGRSPWTPIGDLGADGVARLVTRAATALRHSALVPGAYQVTTGINRRGQEHWVVGRQRRPCRRCGTTVREVDAVDNDPGNRVTRWCPHCQPGPGPEARTVVRRLS